MKQYSPTIKSLLSDKMNARGISLPDVTYFEYRGRVQFYYGATVLLIADVMYENPNTKLDYTRIYITSDAPKNFIKKTKKKKKVSVTKSYRQRIYERDEFKCLKCGEMDLNKLTLDHIKPLSWGGKNTMDNLQTLCLNCNQEKGDKNKISYVKNNFN